jgi:hypothetical protein
MDSARGLAGALNPTQHSWVPHRELALSQVEGRHSEAWVVVDMQVAQFFIVVIGWIIFPATAVALLWASFVFFRQDDSASHLDSKRPPAPSR